MDWIATIFVIVGVWLLCDKMRIAFLINIIGCFFWIGYGIQHLIISIALVNALFILVNIRGWILWGRK